MRFLYVRSFRFDFQEVEGILSRCKPFTAMQTFVYLLSHDRLKMCENAIRMEVGARFEVQEGDKSEKMTESAIEIAGKVLGR